MEKKSRIFTLGNWIFAFCTVFALSMRVQVFSMEQVLACTGGRTHPLLLCLARLRLELQGQSPVVLLLFAAAVWVYEKLLFRRGQAFLPSAALVSVCFSIWTMLGMSYAALGNWDFLFGNGFQMLQAVALFLGWWALYYCAVSSLYRKLDSGFRWREHQRGRKGRLIRRHFFLFSFVVILLAWVPHLCAFFPGTITRDAYYQLQMFYGLRDFTNHWPYVSTLILGGCYSIGKMLLPETMAIFAYILFQSVVCALCYAYVCSTVKKLTHGWGGAVCGLLFFALVPCWGAYAFCVVKDTLYTGLFAWFGAEFCRAVSERKSLHAGRILRLLLSGSLAMLFRNDLIYIALPALLALFLAAGRGQKRKLLSVLAALLVVNLGVYHALQPALGIEDGPAQEMLSVPFQQVARWCVQYGDELSEEEIGVIDAVLDYNTIVELYDPELSDPVKNTYQADCTPEERSAFFALWLQMLQRHPDACIQATFHNSFGYWYPGYDSGLHNYTVYLATDIKESKDFSFELYFSPFWHNLFYSGYLIFNHLPVLSLLEMPGTPSWVLLLVAGAALRKRKGGLLAACVVVLMAFAVCVASPVNGALRYALPQLAFLPSLLALTVRELSDAAQ